MRYMKKQIKIFTALILLFALAVLPACEKNDHERSDTTQEKFSAYSFDYFDTVTTVTGYAESREAFDKIANGILAELEEYHRLFDIYHTYEGMNNIRTINEVTGGAHRTVTVDSRIIDMLLYAKEMYVVTGGKMNVAMGSVLSIWHEYRADGIDDPDAAELPPTARLLDAAEHMNIDAMVIDEAACTVTLTDPKMKLDVGAVAKGYAVEMVVRSLEERGISGYVLNVGGNVRTVGTKPGGKYWTVGIEDPFGGDGYISYLALKGEAVVTSGDYQRYYIVDGKKYHHVIDPETLMPSEGIVAVSVLTKDSAQGDALSTALMCMSPEEGMALVRSLDGVEAQWVLPDGTLEASNGWARYTIEK